MNKQRKDLARRAMASSGWRSMPGMVDETGARVVMVRDGVLTLCTAEGDGLHERPDDGHWLFDFDDFATLGCIEHGLLPSLGFNDAIIDASSNARDGEVRYYIVYRPDPVSFPTKWLSAVEDGSPTKADALIAALEAAP